MNLNATKYPVTSQSKIEPVSLIYISITCERNDLPDFEFTNNNNNENDSFPFIDTADG